MRTRLACFVALLLVPTTIRADGHKMDLSAAFSYAGGSTLLGVHETVAVTSPKPNNKDLSLVGDFSVHFGESKGHDVTKVTSMTGARWSIPQLHPKIVAYGQALIGNVHTSDGSGVAGNDLAFAFGGGFDYVPRRLLKDGVPAKDGWAVRVQAEAIVRPADDAGNYLRFSTGVVYRFH